MKKRRTKFNVKRISEIKLCGKPVMWKLEVDGGFEVPFDVEPTLGKHDYSNCENCKKNIAELTRQFTQKFNGTITKNGFPFCCPYHSKLQQLEEFNREDFVDVPAMAARKIIYTNQQFINCHDSEQWLKMATDYFEHVVDSFGKMPENCGERLYLGEYYFHVVDMLRRSKEVPSAKKDRILEYIISHENGVPDSKTDINVLLSVYEQWLKIFPFDLNSYFGNLRESFENQLPIIRGKPEVNMYNGKVKIQVHTKDSLFEALINLTNKLLSDTNGDVLFEKGLVSDVGKMQVDIIRQERRQKIKDGYRNSSPDNNHRFRKMIKDWLKDEREFWLKLRKVLSDKESNKDASQHDQLIETIDKDVFVYHKIPFEIEIIFSKYYQDEDLRFVGFKTKDYHFYTPKPEYETFIKHWRNGEIYTESLQSLNEENVQPYYKAYGDGFTKGYNGFDTKIKNSTSVFSDNQATIRRIFGFVITPFPGLASYGRGELKDKSVKIIDREIWFEAGVKAGENYKAWYFILNNPSYFVELFRTHKPIIDLYKAAVRLWKDKPGGTGVYSNLVQLLTEIGEPVEVEQKDQPTDGVVETIDNCLRNFKANISDADYATLVHALKTFFESGRFPKLKKAIKIFGKVNKKRFGWMLNELYRLCGKGRLSTEYLRFGKESLSIFQDVEFDESDILGSNLYKYYTSKPQQ